MPFNIDDIKTEYTSNRSSFREVGKYLFSIATFGIGALILWGSTRVIKEGQIGLRKDARGKMTLLPPGRHSNFPWESYAAPTQDLSSKTVFLGPYKIITVESGFVAKTVNKGELEILNEGQHLLSDASHVFNEFISIKQETKRLETVKAYTRDNVGITLQADVRYEINNPKLAISKIENIEESIKQISEMQLSSVIGHHNLAELIPAAKGLNTGNSLQAVSSKAADKADGLSEVVNELMASIGENLNELGIKLLNIGIISWGIDDKHLAHELGQGAVIQSQTASKMLTAERDAKIMTIEAEARAKARQIDAQSMAEAASLLQKNPAAIELTKLDVQAKIIAAAKPGTHLFYGATGTPGFFQLPLATDSGAEKKHDAVSNQLGK